MNKFLLPIFLLIFNYIQIKSAWGASPPPQAGQCTKTVNNIVREIKSKGIPNAEALVSSYYHNADQYSVRIKNPRGYSAILFEISGNTMFSWQDEDFPVINNLLNSKSLILNWVMEVGNQCKGLGYVLIGIKNTDITLDFAIDVNGNVFSKSCNLSPGAFQHPESSPMFNFDTGYCAFIPLNVMIRNSSRTIIEGSSNSQEKSPVISIPIAVEPYKQKNCQATVDNVMNEIKNKGVNNVSFKILRGIANEQNYGNPTNRTDETLIVMGNTNINDNNTKEDFIINNIFYSPVLMNSWADKIVRECSNTAVVSFLYVRYWVALFAIQEDGKTKRRECLAPDSEMLPWHQSYCP